jgi:hypothetical protein
MGGTWFDTRFALLTTNGVNLEAGQIEAYNPGWVLELKATAPI